IVLLLIIAVLMIVASLGFGGVLGSGNGDGNNNSSSGVSENSSDDSTENTQTSESPTETETIPEETTESVKYLDVTVSGDIYLVNDVEKTLDDFISLAKDGENNVVRITDDNAVADAMESLISTLESNNIQYIEPTA
ncbi:MAG: hypothetical protein K2J44_06230, partial [Ruminococcus sp.]|nr:hypothetical protein [Ruminococcus sp.]